VVLVPFVLAVFFLVRETTFTRKKVPIYTVGMAAAAKADAIDADFATGIDEKKTKVIETTEDLGLKRSESSNSMNYFSDDASSVNDVKHTWRQNLVLYRGRLTDRSLVKAFFQPFPLIVFPSVLFSTIVNGAFLTWTTTSGIITHQVLLYPPYNLQPDVLAYISLPGSVVNLVFSIASGIASDWIIKFMARRNKGVYEPEFRLLMMIPAVLFSTLGFLILGPLYARKAPVAQLVIGGLLFHVGGPFASSAAVTYIFDTMQNTSTEAFVATSLFKHLFMLVATSYVPAWFTRVGPVRCYQTLAILNLSFAALAIPMYCFGKRLRGMVSLSLLVLHDWSVCGIAS
jgi:hypothetical protein